MIAAVEGHAVAAGLALAVWCDLRVASDSAVFGVFCRRFGGPMPNAATVHLPRIVGESKALELFWGAEPFGAQEALDMGLVSKLFPADELMERTVEWARKVSENAPIPVRI